MVTFRMTLSDPNRENDLFWYFGLRFAFLARVKLDTSNLVHLLIMASSSPPMTRSP